jgi:hypothetical protein
LGTGGSRKKEAPPMTDLWILLLTIGLFGSAAGFVRLLGRL